MMSNPWSGAVYGGVIGLFLALIPGESQSQPPEDKP